MVSVKNIPTLHDTTKSEASQKSVNTLVFFFSNVSGLFSLRVSRDEAKISVTFIV